MMIREPVVAGSFYPASSQQCREQVQACIPTDVDVSELPDRPIGGIVPHAGWMCSGRVAGRVLAALAARRSPRTFVIFGAVHAPGVVRPAIFADGAWQSPLGQVSIDQRLAQRICSQTSLIHEEPYAHQNEHSIEVQVPLIQHLFAQAAIVPIMVPPNDDAHEVGEAVGRTVQAYDADVAFIGSTDLTHYGPQYGFTPRGVGSEALRWAKDVNDRRLIERIVALEADQIVPEARRNHNACGAGAVAATIAACRQCGADRAVVLEHTTSYEVLGGQLGQTMEDSVGYVGILLG
ncbi:MAG: AmmeMemoRadiSam system protein B [Phycisphaerae bacterium]